MLCFDVEHFSERISSEYRDLGGEPLKSLKAKNIRTKTQCGLSIFIIFMHITFHISLSKERVG